MLSKSNLDLKTIKYVIHRSFQNFANIRMKSAIVSIFKFRAFCIYISVVILAFKNEGVIQDDRDWLTERDWLTDRIANRSDVFI